MATPILATTASIVSPPTVQQQPLYAGAIVAPSAVAYGVGVSAAVPSTVAAPLPSPSAPPQGGDITAALSGLAIVDSKEMMHGLSTPSAPPALEQKAFDGSAVVEASAVVSAVAIAEGTPVAADPSAPFMQQQSSAPVLAPPPQANYQQQQSIILYLFYNIYGLLFLLLIM